MKKIIEETLKANLLSWDINNCLSSAKHKFENNNKFWKTKNFCKVQKYQSITGLHARIKRKTTLTKTRYTGKRKNYKTTLIIGNLTIDGETYT